MLGVGNQRIDQERKYQLIMSRLSSIDGERGAKQTERIPNGLHLSLLETPDSLKILATSQATNQAYIKAERALASGMLTREQRKQIALLVAEINNSDYCLVTHSDSAKNCGLSEEDIRLARRATAVDPKAEAMLRFTLLVTLQRGDIKREDLRAVFKAGFSEGEVMEIIANIALNIFANYLNVVFRNEADCAVLQANVA